MPHKTQKRLAAEVLKVGVNRIWLDPERAADIKEAITKEDIRALIKEGAIKSKKVKGVSRGRFRKRLKQIKKGLRRGIGSRKGKIKPKRKSKRVWVKRVRFLRKLLKVSKAKLSREKYWKLYKEIKSSQIKTQAQLLEGIKGK